MGVGAAHVTRGYEIRYNGPYITVSGKRIVAGSKRRQVDILNAEGVLKFIIDQLKNIAQIEHSRHRNSFNFLVNLVTGLVACSFADKKSSVKI